MEYISAKEAARRMGVSYRWVMALVYQGRLRAERVGREWLILPEDIDKVEIFPHGNFKLSLSQITEIKQLAGRGRSPKELAMQFGVSVRTIYRHLSK